MSWTRDAIANAIVSSMQATLSPSLVPAGNITRRLVPLNELAKADLPAIAIVEQPGEAPQPVKGLPTLMMLDWTLVLYVGSDESSATDVLAQYRSGAFNPILDSLYQVFAPDPLAGAQTLGGLTSHTWIDGQPQFDESLATVDRMVLELPLRTLVGQDNDPTARRFLFGVGRMYAELTGAFANATTPALNTPVRLGGLQEVSVDGLDDLVLAKSDGPYALSATVRGKRVTGAAKFATVDALVANQLYFSADAKTTGLLTVDDLPGTVPSSGPFTVTPAVPAGGTYDRNLGVYDATTGAALVRVAAVTAAGQYSLAGGTYTFHSSDAGRKVVFCFTYTATTSAIALTNATRGLAQTFRVVLTGGYNGHPCVLVLYRCVTRQISVPQPNEKFAVPDFKFEALDDGTGNIGILSIL